MGVATIEKLYERQEPIDRLNQNSSKSWVINTIKIYKTLMKKNLEPA